MTRSLRCIPDTAHSAAFNMAADLYFMEQCSGTQTVFLRTYTWNPAAITIGSMQRARSQLDLNLMHKHGIDWVRRPTGGRAVLHCNDVTYSCIFSYGLAGMGTTVEETYTIIMRCLVAGLTHLGICPEIHDSCDPQIKSGRHVKLPCFLAPNRNEIMVHGRKLVGSAQYRSKYAVLQHGSIPMTTEGTTLPHYLQMSDKEKIRQIRLLQEKSIALVQIDRKIDNDALISALQHGFSSIISGIVHTEPLQDTEMESIKKLMQSDRFKKQWLTDPTD